MKTLLNYLKVIGIVLFFVTLLALIWFAPTLFSLDEDSPFASVAVQILLSLIVLVLAALCFYIRYLMQQNPVATEDVAQPSLKESLKQQKMLFKKHVNETFDNLKAAFQIWGNKKSRYLRKLPWYIVFGGPDSGKSSLLLNAGLDFSPTEALGVDPLQSGDSHQDYVWRFSKEAVLLDISAQASQKETESNFTTFWGINVRDPFWSGILKLIKRFRGRKPLNGALVTMSLPALLMQADKFNQIQRQALSGILQTLHQQLKIQTPVYLIFTKCDLIAGFEEFFADLTKDDREQAWGIAFPAQPFALQQQALDYFNAEYDQLIARLNERIFLRLEVERDPNRRLALSYFAQQMQICKQAIAEYILQDENLQLRGVYFVSNLQGGKPYDFLLSALSAKYQLTRPASVTAQLQEKPYFLRRLFHDIILSESDWVGNSPYLQRMKKYTHQATWAVSSFALLFALCGLSISYERNQTNLDTIQRYLPDYQQASSQLLPADKSLAGTLPLLTTLKSIQDIYANAPSKWLLYFEFYQPYKISNTIEDVWQRALSTQLMPRVALRLETMLQTNQDNPELLYQTLKGYLVFSPAPNTDPNWLKPPVANDVANTLPDQPDEQDQINNFLDQALQYSIDSIPLNDKLIEQTRDRLRKVPPVEFAYYELKQEAMRTQGQFNLGDKLGPIFNNTFVYQNNSMQGVPTLYTLEGYEDLHGRKSSLLIKHSAQIYWILGLDKNADTNLLASQMTPELWTRYDADYINDWQSLLANIQVAPFTSLPQAIQALNVLTGMQNPLLAVLVTTKANTLPIRGRNISVAQQFAALNAISGIPGKPSAQYTAMMKNLVALRDYLNGLNSAPNTAQMEFQDASAYLQGKMPTNPIALLKAQAQQMPAPLNRWLNTIADNSFNLLLQGAHQTINTAWQSSVLPAYQTNIQGRFPFNAQSDAFVSMASFGDFFGGNGVLAQFMQTYLLPFIDASHIPWHQYSVGAYSLGLSADTVAQMQKATLIRTMYFPNNDKNPSLQFSVQPRFLDPQSSSIYVQLANQNLTYRHGPQQSLSWKWPMPSDTQQVNVSFSDFQGQNFSTTFDGPWAWFKLLGSTQLQSTGAPGHYIWTINQDKHQASFDIWAANDMPLFDLQTLETFSLPGSI